jgi:amino acid adenylation domain-containing protein
MDDLRQRIAQLSPAKRALLELHLQQKAAAGPAVATMSRRHDSAPCPLSFAQQRLWFLNQLAPDNPVYNMPKAFQIRGTLNVAALRQALDAIVARHEALRTAFAFQDDRPVQRLMASRSVACPVIDLRTYPEATRQAEVQRLLCEEIQRPFDLNGDLLLRSLLLRLDEAEHILLLLTHHIASDKWSTSILCRELSALYGVFALGQPLALPELPVQYADYALWQRQWLQGAVLETHLDYWTKRLAGAAAVLTLPTDRPRPTVQTFRGARCTMALPAALAERLTALSRQAGVTLFMTLLAAFQTLLCRYSGQTDLVVGAPIAGRTRRETEALIGCFFNTLALRTDLGDDPTFCELLERVREVAMGAYAHQELPFEKLVEILQPERSLSYEPLCQVMLNFHNTPQVSLQLAGLTLTPLDIDNGASPLDLTLTIRQTEAGLQGVAEYSTDLFEATTIARMMIHFQTLLTGIVTEPTQRLSALPLLPADEQQQFLATWNTTQASYPEAACLHTLFEAQAAHTPDTVAVIYERQRLTYAALNQRANQLAHYLRRHGVGPEVFVGLCVERSLEMLVGMLGILKAGGAYVPLDPAYPPERLAFMLTDAQLRVCVTQAGRLGNLAGLVEVVIELDTDCDTISQECGENPTAMAGPENLAYVIYTSGSTGRPKGVQIPHRAVVNCLWALRQRPGMTAHDRLLAVTTLSFDIAVVELLLPLLVGAHVVLASRAVAADGVALKALLAQVRPTVMQATPSTWRLLLEAGWQGDPGLKLLCGGEALPPELATQLCARSATAWNLYGPTETTIWSTVAPVEAGARVVSIGRPLANTELYVLDATMRPVPIGVVGELYIGGVGLARGYLHRPDLTSERFLPHPFRTAPGARVYRTGDLARYRADSTLELLGRVDQQVKVRGFRVELGEIEAVLEQHAAVQAAVVLAREDTPGDQRLVAYVVPRQALPPDGSDLRRALQQQVPDYMVPAAFVFLAALPLTPNGKRDRQALPAPEPSRATVETPLVPPREPLELQLTVLWEEVLARRPIGVRDDFFALGGHSLLAARLFAQITKHTGRQLPLATLFQAPTIEHLARLLRQDGWVAPWASLVPIQPGGSRPPFFCLHAAAGNVLSYRELAKHLGADQPFYGVQAQGLDSTQPLRTQVEAMAAHYLTEIQTLQPVGPYCLGGLCFGGVVAFEMAQQLRRQGQQVALLALLDTYGPGYRRSVSTVSPVQYRLDRLLRRVKHHQENLRVLTPRQWLPYVAERTSRFASVQARAATRWCTRMAHRRGPGPAPDLSEASTGLEATHRAAARRYVPQVYAGSLTLFRASKQPLDRVPDPYLGWAGMATTGIAVYEVPGDHLSMLREPWVEQLAGHLRQCLRQAQQLTVPDKEGNDRRESRGVMA